MLDKIKGFFKNMVQKQVVTGYSILDSNSTLTPYERKNYSLILQKLGGYQYIAADIVAATVASQTLRLYATVPSGNSKFHRGKKQINPYWKPIPVDSYTKLYLNGKTEVKHKNLVHKSLASTEGIVEILEHDALDIIHNPNPYMSEWEMFYQMTMATQFYGNGFLEKLRFPNNQISELWYIPSQYMEIIQGATHQNFIEKYKWGEAIGKNIEWDKDDIVDFKIPGIGNSQVYGKSKLEIVWRYVHILDSALDFKQAITENTGRPDILISVEETRNVDIEGMKTFEHQWNDRNFGPKQSGKMAMVPGKIKVDVLPRATFNYEDDAALIRAVGLGFKVPESKLLPASTVMANSSQQERDFQKGTIDSYLTMIEDDLNRDFLSDFPDSENMFFAFDPIIQEDKEFRLKRQIAYKVNGIYTANRILEQEGEETVEGGDDLTNGGNNSITVNNGSQSDTDGSKSLDTVIEHKDMVDAIVKVVGSIETPKMPDIHNHTHINVNNETEEVIE